MFDQICVAANHLRERLMRTKGYDDVKVQLSFSVSKYRVSYECWLELSDSFQSFGSSVGVDNGAVFLIGETPDELDNEIEEKIKKLRGREQRELTYMMNGITNSIENRDLLTTAAGRDFANALLEERNKFVHLIEAPKAS